MENNNVLFDKDELLLLGDESICNYSGLPSVSSYDESKDEMEFVLGHS